jgi:hypothetical protein
MRFAFLALLFTGSLVAHALPEPVSKNLKKNVQEKVASSGERLLALDCPFLLQLYHPKDESENQLALCIHTVSEERGVFLAYACVASLAEPDSQVISPFYGKTHWGVEGKCSTDQMVRKLKDPQIPKTVNPFTSFQQKRAEGKEIRLLRDELKIWEHVKPLLEPNKKK